MTMRTAMVMAGGTGGHVFPGLAVAAALVERGWRVIWLGHPEGMEAGLVSRAGLPFEPLRFSALRGKGALTMLRLPLNLLRAVTQARHALRRVRPQVVLGMGGYVTVPGGAAARLLGIPLVLHEQNAIAGLANRFLARFADAVIEAFPGAFGRAGGGRVGSILALLAGPLAPKRLRLLGNPVRSELAALPAPAQRAARRQGPLRVLVVGGSLGAKALNETVPAAMGMVLAAIGTQQMPQVVHQSGRAHLEALQHAYAGAGVQARLVAFIDDMAAEYGAADLVICRAGAATVSELAVAGVAAILVPYPHAVDDHQTMNAQWLADAGGAWIAPQALLSAGDLAARIVALARFTPAAPGACEAMAAQIEAVPAGRAALVAMAERARALGLPDAAQRVADLIETLAQR